MSTGFKKKCKTKTSVIPSPHPTIIRSPIIDRITCTPTFRHETVTETGKYKDTVNLPKTTHQNK